MMGQYGYGDWGMMGGVSPLGDFLMLAFGLVVLAGLVLLVLWVLRAGGLHAPGGHPGGMGMTGGGTEPSSPATPAADEAIALARKRLASGEISREEFDRLMEALAR